MGNLVIGSTTVISDSSGTPTIQSGLDVPASVGSSLVLVKSSQGFAVDSTATTSSAYIENCFNSTYRDYVVHITGKIGSTQGDMSFRFGNSSGRNSNSHYIFSNKGYDSAGNSRTYQGQNTTSAGLFNGAKGDGDSGSYHDRLALTILLHNPQGSGGTSWAGTMSNPRHGTSFIVSYIGGMLRLADYSATNMQFFLTAGSATLNFQSYGIKTS